MYRGTEKRQMHRGQQSKVPGSSGASPLSSGQWDRNKVFLGGLGLDQRPWQVTGSPEKSLNPLRTKGDAFFSLSLPPLSPSQGSLCCWPDMGFVCCLQSCLLIPEPGSFPGC